MAYRAFTLAIDCGNTNTEFALMENLNVVTNWRRATDDRRTADEDLVWLSQLMALEGIETSEISIVAIASVRPQSTFALKQLGERLTGKPAIVIGEPGVELKVSPALLKPKQVGADRLVNARALEHKGKLPAIVVDFGTATNFDYIDENGAYAGGVIAPGVNTSIEALYQAAAKLPRIGIIQKPAVIGTDTVSAMQSGVFWGYVGLVEGIISRLKTELGVSAYVVATGGLAALFDTATEFFDEVANDLTITGIALVARDISISRQPEM